MRWPWSKREQRYVNPWREIERQQSYGLNELLAISGVPSYSGVSVTEDSAMRLSAVWACVDLLASTISSLPIDCYRYGDRNPVPLPRILEEPSAIFDREDWLYAGMASLLLTGNCWGDRVSDNQIELLDDALVSVRFNERGQIDCRVAGKPRDYFDLFHVRAYPKAGEIKGLSPIQYAAKQSTGLGLAIEKFAAQWFGEGCIPSAVIETPEGTTVGQGKKLYQSITQGEAEGADDMAGGHRGRHKPMVLGPGGKYKPITVSPNESQFLESSKANVSTIARIFQVPPSMVGGDEGSSNTYANVNERSLFYLRYGVNRWLVKWDRALSKLVPNTQYVKIKAAGLLRPTTKERYESHAIALGNAKSPGWMTVDEVRALEDMPPLGGRSTPKSSNGSREDEPVEPWVMS